MCAPWHESEEWDWSPETAAEDTKNFPGEKFGSFDKRGDPTWQASNHRCSGRAAIQAWVDHDQLDSLY